MYDPAQPRTQVFFPAMLSGVLLYCTYFPLNLGFLAWIALVPLLGLVDANARPRRIYFAVFLGGLYWFVPVLQWIRVAHPAMYGSWMALSVYCSLFLVLTMYVVRRLVRAGMPLWLAAPVGFVAIEYLRTHFPVGFEWLDLVGARTATGFGWYLLGQTQHDWLALLQTADLAGMYGITFIVVMVNAVLYSMLRRYAPLREWLKAPAPTATLSPKVGLLTGAILFGMVGYGIVRLQHDEFTAGPNVALLQGNLPQDLKIQRGQEMAEHFAKLASEAVRPKDPNTPKPDLVIWPETSYVDPWFDVVPGREVRQASLPFQRAHNLFRDSLRENVRQWRTPQLLGLNCLEWEGDETQWKYNSAVLMDGKGNYQGRYDKIHLVLFGEYVPFRQTLPFLQKFTPYEGDYSCKPGEHWTRFEVQGKERAYLFGVVICYEDSDPALARSYVAPGTPKVDFLVNISNDGWFDGTAQHEQHLAIARFRAVESRRSLVRAVNMGISAIIDADGRVVALPGATWSESKKVEGIVRGAVPIDQRSSLYALWGDWLAVGTWFVIIVVLIRGRRPKPAAPPSPTATS